MPSRIELEPRLAPSAAIVRDLAPGNGSGRPEFLQSLSGRAVFLANRDVTTSIWTTDGTATGTVKLVEGESAAGLWAAELPDGRFLFNWQNNSSVAGAIGHELWVSDGTPAGTKALKDINPGFSSSGPRELVALGGKVYFTAGTTAAGDELWVSDGTAAGTVMVKDINPTSGVGSFPQHLTIHGGKLYFTANDGATGTELWVSDGTEGGTKIVADVVAGATGGASSFGTPMISHGGKLYFATFIGSNRRLHVTDGTAGGTSAVPTIGFVSKMVSAGGKLYVNASRLSSPFETGVWTTDGTAGGTTFLAPTVSGNVELIGHDGLAYFAGTAAATGTELYRSDGTVIGTVPLSDYAPGAASARPTSLISHAGAVYFFADDGATGFELTRFDPATSQVSQVRDVNAGAGSSVLVDSSGIPTTPLRGLGPWLLYTGSDTTDFELWRSDGTSGGTVQVKDLVTENPPSSNPSNLVALGNTTFFKAGVNGRELWKSDGTPEGTLLLQTDTSPIGRIVPIGPLVYFTRTNNTLHRTDGTPAGTYQIHVATDGFSGRSIDHIVAYNGWVYFDGASPGQGDALWRTDGTIAGTSQFAKINVDVGVGVGYTGHMVIANGLLFFTGSTSTTGFELYVTDGTVAGTKLTRDIGPGAANAAIKYVTAAGNRVFFAANDGASGEELWVSDGTLAGTNLTLDIHPSSGAGMDQPVVMGDNLYFAAFNPTSGRELWTSDGTPAGTKIVLEIIAGSSGGNPFYLTVAGSKLFFSADGGTATGRELWVSDGTAAGTKLTKDLRTGPGQSSLPNSITALGSKVVFTASIQTGNEELFVSDGTSAGTFQLGEIYEGVFGSTPQSLVTIGSKTFFAASNKEPVNSARELWMTDGTLAGTLRITSPASQKLTNPEQLANIGGTLFYSAVHPSYGRELHRLVLDGEAVEFSSSSFEVTEGGSVLVTARLSGALPHDTVIPVGVTGGDALPTEYTIGASITILAGQLEGGVTLTTLDDTIDERDEQIVLTLGEPTTPGATRGSRLTTTAIIRDNDGPAASFASTGKAVYEHGPGPIAVEITLAGPTIQDVELNIVATGTATAADYKLSASRVVIPAFATKASVFITLIDDADSEADESIVLTLANPVNAEIGAVGSVTYSIRGPEPAIVAFATVGSSLGEAGGAISIVATLSAALDSELVVPVTLSGSAKVGGDFTLSGGAYTFPAGATTAGLTFTPVDNTFYELAESVTLTLGTPGSLEGVLGSPVTHTVSIIDDDPAPVVSFDTGTIRVFEPASGTKSYPVTVRLSRPAGESVSVPFTLSGTAGVPADYTITGVGFNAATMSGAIGFSPGMQSATLSIQVASDGPIEAPESIVVTLGAGPGYLLASDGRPTSLVGSIIDTNQVFFDITYSPTAVLEGKSSKLTGQLYRLDEAGERSPYFTPTPVSVPVTTAGTATVGVDYTLSQSSFEIPAGGFFAQITIDTVPDFNAEANEPIEFTAIPGGVLGASRTRYTVTIVEPLSQVEFAPGPVDFSESDGFVTIPIRLSDPADTDVLVSFTDRTSVGFQYSASPWDLAYTAFRFSDYNLPTQTTPYTTLPSLIIPAGSTTASFTFEIRDDLSYENLYEWLDVVLTANQITSTGVLVRPLNVVERRYSIRDNDNQIRFTTPVTSVREGQSLTLTARLARPTESALSLPLLDSSYDARSDDYSGIPATLEFAAGAQEASFTISAASDTFSEGPEQFRISFATLPIQFLGQASWTREAVVTIVDSPTAAFATPTTLVGEGFKPFDIPIQLSEPATGEIVLSFTYAGDGVIGVNYETPPTTLTIPAGASSASLTLQLRQDGVRDNTKLIDITVAGIQGPASFPGTRYHVVHLYDADLPPSVVVQSNTPTGAGSSGGSGGGGSGGGGNGSGGGSGVGSSGSSSVYTPSILGGSIGIASGDGGEPTVVPDPNSAGVVTVVNQPPVVNTPPGGLPPGLGGDGVIAGGLVFFDANGNLTPDFLDLNGNGAQDAGEPAEPTTFTGYDGSFRLIVPPAFDLNGDGFLTPAEGRMVLTGGKDLNTDAPTFVPLASPAGATVISPITTLLTRLMVHHGMSESAALARVRLAFSLPDVNYFRFNFAHGSVAAHIDALPVQQANTAIQNLIALAARMLSANPGDPPVGAAAALAFEIFADQLAADVGPIDLATRGTFAGLLEGTLQWLGRSLDPALIDGAGDIAAALNASLRDIDRSDTVNTPLAQIARHQKVAQISAADALAAAVRGETPIGDIVAAFTGANLDSAIAAAVTGDIIAPLVRVSDAEVLEGASGQSFIDFTVSIDRPSKHGVTLAYRTADGIARAADSDYVSTTGTLTWTANDAAPKTVRVYVNGDTTFEFNETFLLIVSDPVNAALRDDIGVGLIKADDALVYVAPAGQGPNAIRLEMNLYSVRLFRNDVPVAAGVLTLPVPIVITGADTEADTLRIDWNSPRLAQAGITFHGGAGAGDALSLYDGGALTAAYAPGEYTIDGAKVAFDGVETHSSFKIGAPPQVGQVIVNGGAAQRSRVDAIDFYFDTGITLPGGAALDDSALELRRSDGVTVGFTMTPSDFDGRTGVTLRQFTGAGASFGSLADGRWTLRVRASHAVDATGRALDGDADGAPGGDFLFGLHRLVGDSNGDATVNAADFLAFRLSYLSANPIFDFDGDGQVGASDFLRFRLNFLASV